jgi:hypothetical protein
MDRRQPDPQDASGDIYVNLGSSTLCWTDDIEGSFWTTETSKPYFEEAPEIHIGQLATCPGHSPERPLHKPQTYSAVPLPENFW